MKPRNRPADSQVGVRIPPLELPPGWRMVKFGDVVRQVSEAVRDPAREGLDRVVGLEHIDADDLHIKRWDDIGEGTSFSKLFRKGQVLFGRRRAYLRKVAYAEFDGICSGDITVMEPEGDRLLPELLPFLVQTDGFYEHTQKVSAGGLSPRAKWRDLAGYEFALPPIPEQRRIAEILWAAEAAREGFLKCGRAVCSLQSARAEMYFGRMSDMARSGSTEVTRLADLCSVPICNGIFRSTQKANIGARLVNVTDIYSGFSVDVDRLAQIEVSAEESTRYSARSGDVIFNRSSLVFDGIGHACLVPATDETMVFECHLMRVRPNQSRILPAYLTRYALSRQGRRYIESVARVTTMTTINQQDLGGMPIPTPSLEVQNEIERDLSSLERMARASMTHAASLHGVSRACAERSLDPIGVIDVH